MTVGFPIKFDSQNPLIHLVTPSYIVNQRGREISLSFIVFFKTFPNYVVSITDEISKIRLMFDR